MTDAECLGAFRMPLVLGWGLGWACFSMSFKKDTVKMP
eukprot:CAMPEP_0194595138 /NCGR_PEP_ID=MMETSP0292-20121207/24750_1 /TAXON_ID=39354 /ORGANISM="Heterosigma akashiwo, Strain CCMP2393" /LENGTH=37 /DNA_ID= /DNA_START= /DNA_END= /DNA_ORIENTATION=